MIDNNTIGDWLYQELESVCIFEQTGWAAETVKRVGDRLQQGRTDENRKEVLVPWLEEFTAFTAPGKYIFFSRSLLEMCQDDEMTAFIIAHELAHHDLGHLDLFPDWLTQFTGRQAAPFLRVLYLNLLQRLYGPERECAADRRGIDLCIEAGYDPGRCLAIFDILEKNALDMRDLTMVFGPDESDDELSPDASLHTKGNLD
jgi:predicted Zn-dependent protease